MQKIITAQDEKLNSMEKSIEAQFLKLREELGQEFDKNTRDTTEIRGLITGFQDQKATMIADIEKSFGDFREKSGEMRELIGTSESILKKSLDQMSMLMDGSVRAMNVRFEAYDTALAQIGGKHMHYDSLIGRQQQQQGKGGKTGFFPESTAFTGGKGLIHDKDIKMPEFPQKPENTELFRRWWKDVAEYCENKDDRRFADCPSLFSAIRGYKNVIESKTEVMLLFQAADAHLKEVTPSDQVVHTLTSIWNVQ